MATVLITGGSGLIGSRLTELLISRGYHVRHLGRSPGRSGIETFLWDIEKNQIDHRSIDGADAIIHLAGENIGAGRWTSARKQKILDSRIRSTQLLRYTLQNHPNSVKTFLGASAVGYYGGDCGEATMTEDSPPGNDFLAQVTRDWEAEVSSISSLAIRVVMLRTGIVLSRTGGALEPMARQVKWWVGAPLGTGQQFLSWVHLDDHCRAFIELLENSHASGPYNSAAPFPVTNEQFTRQLAKVLRRPLWLPRVPAVLLKLILGEMSVLVLGGCKVSSARLESTGFRFQYTKLEEALADLL